jgi:predicted lysophospholipase L1 biosynthesis ABC-type transport system permease subunit
MFLMQYLLLGLFATFGALVLSVAVCIVLARYVFHIRFFLSSGSLLLPALLGIFSVLLIGFFGANILFRIRPLALLRSR